jgi:hypothetical protein
LYRVHRGVGCSHPTHIRELLNSGWTAGCDVPSNGFLE